MKVRSLNLEARATTVVAVVALAARAAVMIWAGNQFAPAADGIYYHRIAERMAAGLGSTWLWPDGAVTYVAHYPVGYSALLALPFRLFGPWPVVGGWLNAAIGTLAAVAAHRVARRAMSERAALVAGLGVALHPALVFYTPALMTEGVTAGLLIVAVWMAARGSLVPLGLVLGAATLVRPQVFVLAPWLGFLSFSSRGSWRARWGRAAAVTALALAVCAPWVARNCVRMKQCGVSFNGGWNLLIGAGEKATGTWAPVDVPDECKTVWDEAAKDQCFGRAARAIIAARPARWLSLVPNKLAATFDYSGAPGFYLHASNPHQFDENAKTALGVVETLYERLVYGAVLLAAARAAGPRRRVRGVLCVVGGLCLLSTHAYLAIVLAAVAWALIGRALLELPILVPAMWGALAATAATHAVFFGAGRYAMVVFPLVTALAPLGVVGVWSALRARLGTFDRRRTPSPY